MNSLRNTVGFLLQMAALTFLPMMIIWQLDFGFKLLWMPTLTLLALVMFWVGHFLRDKAS